MQPLLLMKQQHEKNCHMSNSTYIVCHPMSAFFVSYNKTLQKCKSIGQTAIHISWTNNWKNDQSKICNGRAVGWHYQHAVKRHIKLNGTSNVLQSRTLFYHGMCRLTKLIFGTRTIIFKHCKLLTTLRLITLALIKMRAELLSSVDTLSRVKESLCLYTSEALEKYLSMVAFSLPSSGQLKGNLYM